MEQKTKVNAENGKQELRITREFDLPLALLFEAYMNPEILEQWMGTKVLKLENKKHGSYQFETTNAQGNVVFKANGVIHEFIPNHKITRTFEIEDTPTSAIRFPIQLEFLDFQELTNNTSKLNIHIVYRSVADRDQVLQLPFAHGLSMAHNRLQEIVAKLN
jgi:uncharacterized protein YndB with AHSA1/START domain